MRFLSLRFKVVVFIIYFNLKKLFHRGTFVALIIWKKNGFADAWPVLFVLVYKEGLQGYKFMETQKGTKNKVLKGK